MKWYYAEHLTKKATRKLHESLGWLSGNSFGVQSMVAIALVELESNHIPILVLNPRDIEVSITKGTVLVRLKSIHSLSSVLIVNLLKNTNAAFG